VPGQQLAEIDTCDRFDASLRDPAAMDLTDGDGKARGCGLRARSGKRCPPDRFAHVLVSLTFADPVAFGSACQRIGSGCWAGINHTGMRPAAGVAISGKAIRRDLRKCSLRSDRPGLGMRMRPYRITSSTTNQARVATTTLPTNRSGKKTAQFSLYQVASVRCLAGHLRGRKWGMTGAAPRP
jgi:hypothetical protein